MDEWTYEVFANREEPIPVVSFDQHEDDSERGENEEGREEAEQGRKQSKGFFSRSTIKDKLHNSSEKQQQQGPSMQDRLLERLLQQVIPVEDSSSSRDASTSTTTSTTFTERPAFNITTMSNNFRRFNARIGVVFVFQARMIRLLSWRNWAQTLSFLAVYTFVCIDPSLLTVLPLALLILGIFIPAFMTRHPPPPVTISNAFDYSPSGPPIAPAPMVKPVKDFSKDFFRNMRDLQNGMEDFSRAHDKVISSFAPLTNFSNEALSSTLFLFLFAAAGFMFIASHLIPFRLIFLIGGWIFTCVGHPTIQKILVAAHKEYIHPREKQAKSWLDNFVEKDMILDSEPETREVEIFELQRLSSAGEWESWLFSPSPYDPLSPARIAEERPKGTRFFEDVQPPNGWEWSEKKWALDLWSREWIEDRMITGVEVETEGERWVYDIEYEKDKDGAESIAKSKTKQKKQMPSWEEGTSAKGKRGDWRRRRWVRMVKRNVRRSSDAK